MLVQEKVVELYSDAELEKLKTKIKIWTGALCALGLAGLTACIAMAALTTTGNAERMELACVGTAIVTGWVVIYCAIFVVTAARREYGHATMLRTEERERIEGPVKVTKERLLIKKSIAVRRVEVETENGPVRLLVTDRRADKLAKAGASAVYVAHGYVAGYDTNI